MNDNPAEPASIYPASPVLALRQACRRAGCDEDGKRCPACPLKDLCDSEARWFVAFRLH
jgi:hypothetical protein